MPGNPAADSFEHERKRLRALAVRMLGNAADAEDAVQDTWLRLSAVDVAAIDSLPAWLTTTLTRLCLDQLRRRRTRGTEALTPAAEEQALTPREPGPDEAVDLAQAVGEAMLVVLETLEPAERVAVVLHDVFATPFDEIAGMLGKSPAAIRQLASRGRRKILAREARPSPGANRQFEIARSYLAASRNGDIPAVLALLAPDVSLRVDRPGGEGDEVVVGAGRVAGRAAGFADRARHGRLVTVDGRPAIAVAVGGRLSGVVLLGFRGGQIDEIQIVLAPERLERLTIEDGPEDDRLP